MDQPLKTRPEAQVFWPRPALAGCIFGAFVRDTRNYPLVLQQRFNHFAATPYCGVSWMFEGQSHIVDWPAGAEHPHAQPVMPPVVFSGPQRQPIASWNPGPVHGMTLAFYPDAMAALADIDMSGARDQIVPVDAVFTGPLLALFKTIMEPGCAEERFRRLEDGLEPLWQRARPQGHAVSHMIADWSRTLAMRAATSGTGRGIRQIERRIRAWAGQSQRDIQSNARAEQVFAMHMATRDDPSMTLARLAVDTGFSDQSHMTRHVRRETGFTPEQLRHLIETDEAFWCYRLMAERF